MPIMGLCRAIACRSEAKGWEAGVLGGGEDRRQDQGPYFFSYCPGIKAESIAWCDPDEYVEGAGESVRPKRTWGRAQ
jgi:hypothetical protein